MAKNVDVGLLKNMNYAINNLYSDIYDMTGNPKNRDDYLPDINANHRDLCAERKIWVRQHPKAIGEYKLISESAKNADREAEYSDIDALAQESSFFEDNARELCECEANTDDVLGYMYNDLILAKHLLYLSKQNQSKEYVRHMEQNDRVMLLCKLHMGDSEYWEEDGEYRQFSLLGDRVVSGFTTPFLEMGVKKMEHIYQDNSKIMFHVAP